MSKEQLNSAIFAGTIRHRRSEPVKNAFTYGVYQVLLDLDELPLLAERVAIFGYNRANITSFHDRDHMGASPEPVRAKLAVWLAERGVDLGDGPVQLLTNLRVLGYVFNPVSYYYCFSEAGELRFIVAEVNNTFGETYCYLLDDLKPLRGRALIARRQKVFHVSPFIGMENIHYDWVMTPPGESLTVQIDAFRDGAKFFDATLNMKQKRFSGRNLVWSLFRYPHMTARTMFLIHWQALKLWFKRAPFYPKPELPPQAWRTNG
jgi:DUF1365 family protein